MHGTVALLEVARRFMCSSRQSVCDDHPRATGPFVGLDSAPSLPTPTGSIDSAASLGVNCPRSGVFGWSGLLTCTQFRVSHTYVDTAGDYGTSSALFRICCDRARVVRENTGFTEVGCSKRSMLMIGIGKGHIDAPAQGPRDSPAWLSACIVHTTILA